MVSNKNIKLIILLILVSLLFILIKYYTRSSFENHESNLIISKLSKHGLYAMIRCVMDQYSYCKKNKINFKIDSSEWLYKVDNGWTDYFEPIDLNFNNIDNDRVKEFGINMIDTSFNVEDDRNTLKEIYRYNERTMNEINKVKIKYNLVDKTYDSIYIRRGDKLGYESSFTDEYTYIELLLKVNPICKRIFLQTDDYTCFINLSPLRIYICRGDKLGYESSFTDEYMYIELLLKVNPVCKRIFLQTDDYTCFINLLKYINENNLQIELITTCDKNSLGAITNNDYKKTLLDSIIHNEKNKTYFDTNKVKQIVPISEMNKEQLYSHTIELICGVDIIINSNICVCHRESSVSKVIKIAHKMPDNVYDILSKCNTDTCMQLTH